MLYSLLRNPHVYKYIHNPEDKICGEEPVSLLILVTSAINHRDRREAIRYITVARMVCGRPASWGAD